MRAFALFLILRVVVSEYFYIVKTKAFEGDLSLKVNQFLEGLNSFQGQLDYELSEAQIDELLGSDAYCGGDIPETVLEKLDQNQALAPQKYFFTSLHDAELFQRFLNNEGHLSEFLKEPVSDWNEKWRESFKKIEVDPELHIIPSWEKQTDHKNDLYIYPGMGFGTGNHETTYLCLKLFRELQLKKKLNRANRVLDFGCGSGILGIAAIKKLSSIVDFVDIDPDALDNCIQNLELNHFQDYSEGHSLILRDRFELKEKYHLVFANILENVLELEKELLVSSLLPSGYLIVSGLLNHQVDGIKETYSNLMFISEQTKGDWSALLFQKG